MVGPTGSVTGIDMTPEMVAKARGAAAEMGLDNVTFVEGERRASCRSRTRSFDVVISNGVIDLIPDKDAVFSEIFRVLSAGWSDPARRRDDPEPGLGGREAQHRPVDRLNRRRSAGSRVRSAAERHGFERIETGDLVDTYARSKFEDTRRKARSSAPAARP